MRAIRLMSLSVILDRRRRGPRKSEACGRSPAHARDTPCDVSSRLRRTVRAKRTFEDRLRMRRSKNNSLFLLCVARPRSNVIESLIRELTARNSGPSICFACMKERSCTTAPRNLALLFVTRRISWTLSKDIITLTLKGKS